jgi:uncharacterized protein YjiK
MKLAARHALATAITIAFATTSAVCAAGKGDGGFSHKSNLQFERIASLPVFLNTDVGLETVAEILDASKDGRTLVYTDGPTGNIGFIDITDPANPVADGVVAMGGEPTSVAVVRRYALVAVNTSMDYVNTSGRLNVVDMGSRATVATIGLGGQPDSVAVSPDGRYAAVVIENERDEGLGDGGLPQLPSGFLVIVDLKGHPSKWRTRTVDLSGLVDVAPEDAEPEYADINKNNIAAVTLQENNHLVFVDLRNGRVVNHYSLGTVDLDQVDTVEDDVIRLTGSLFDVPREPDAVTWIDEEHVVTANEGDWLGGSRGFTVFDMHSSTPVYDSDNTYEHVAVRHGHYPESRSENKGSEPEGVEHARYGANDFLFVGSERGNFVAVYQLRKSEEEPEFVQLLPTMNGPEGLKAIPNRDLFIATSEGDDAAEGLRASVSIYKLQKGTASYPTIVSDDAPDGTPIPWSALSALVADKGDADTLYTVHDSYYKEPKLYTVDVSDAPARITSATTLSNCGACDYDLEGIAQRADGSFWLASEGNASRDNLIIKTAADGTVSQEVALPASVQVLKTNNGFEGVAVVGAGDNEQVYVAFQREWKNDPAGFVRIGRYTPATGDWAFYYYPLDAVESPAGGWIGLSELTYLGDDRFAVIERDNQRGLDAAVKRLYTFSVAGLTPEPQGGGFPVLTKSHMFDLLPGLQAPQGWVQDKAEGLAVTRKGEVYMVTDNDGVDDSTGETQFQHLGNRGSVFGQ